MEPNGISHISEQNQLIDRATLYLCRQGSLWVVVIESPRMRGAVRLRHAGRDSFDARFELLSRARRACPDASILSVDGALEDADYEWRLEVRSVQAQVGDLGVALHRELATARRAHVRRLAGKTDRRHCSRGRHPSMAGLSAIAGRPRSF